MQSLFDSSVHESIVKRIESLSPDSTPAWGKMNVSQMLAHCALTFGVPLSDKKLKGNFFMKLLGGFFKKQLYNDTPWKQNLPTAPILKITDEKNFVEEKQKLLSRVEQFYNAGPDGISKFPHPVFGHFTPQQWGQSMYKHLDHHLRQFGV